MVNKEEFNQYLFQKRLTSQLKKLYSGTRKQASAGKLIMRHAKDYLKTLGYSEEDAFRMVQDCHDMAILGVDNED